MTTVCLKTEQAEVLAHSAADLAANRVVRRRLLLDWRDHWVIEAEVRLRKRGLEMTQDLDKTIASLWSHELMAARAGIARPPALPAIVEAVKLEAGRITADAHSALAEIVAYQLEIETNAGTAGRLKGAWADQALAIGQGVAPLTAAVALLAGLPALATTTTAAMFGFVTVTTVSAPILVAGATGIAALSALGVINLKGLRSAEERKLRVAIEAEMEARLFAPGDTDANASLSAQLEHRFADVAHQLTESC